MNPFLIVVLIMFALDVVGVPFAFWLPHDREPAIFEYTKYASAASVWNAYYWTIYGVVSLLVLAGILGIFRQVRRYQRRPLQLPSQAHARLYWRGSFAIGVACVAIMFLQAGTVPFLTLAHTTLTDYTDAALLRAHFSGRINENLYNINLLFVMPFNIVMAFLCLRRFRYRLASVLLFIVSASFSLAKSQIAAALFVLVIFISLAREVKTRTILIFGIVIILCIAPFYILFSYATNAQDLAEMLTDRIIYGQWGGLPYYFMLFKGDRQPFSVLLPPYVQRLLGNESDSPGRRVMEFMAPDAAAEGIGGNVPTFYVGEAYAVAGTAGVLAAPFLIAAELLLLVLCFQLLPKTPLTAILYSWFLYKTTIGLVGGMSFFLISGFTIALATLAGTVIMRKGARPPRCA